ncbi:hypothetical protein BQ8482_170096 [Mesorhizobium delmotii]|uniref:Uncharacterized protein n=1 Tax=Mesorhizobium delmotii TaxID=1631247 RepID=A0A2P9AHZ2_9HYPH|nr:hypothetical protein BQ8482_170096 [Mesorhizobium delmotii]
MPRIRPDLRWGRGLERARLRASELKAFDGIGVEAVEAIPPGGLLDSLHEPRALVRTPHGAAEAKRMSTRGDLAQVAPRARGGGPQVYGGRRGGRIVAVGRARQLDHRYAWGAVLSRLRNRSGKGLGSARFTDRQRVNRAACRNSTVVNALRLGGK